MGQRVSEPAESKKRTTWSKEAELVCKTFQDGLVWAADQSQCKSAIAGMADRIHASCSRTSEHSHLLVLADYVLHQMDWLVTRSMNPSKCAKQERSDLLLIASGLDAHEHLNKEDKSLFAKLPDDLKTHFRPPQESSSSKPRVLALSHLPYRFVDGLYAADLCENDELLLHHTICGDDDAIETVTGFAFPEPPTTTAAIAPEGEEAKRQEAIRAALTAARSAAADEVQDVIPPQRSYEFVIGGSNVRNTTVQALKGRHCPYNGWRCIVQGSSSFVPGLSSIEGHSWCDHGDHHKDPQHSISTRLLILYRCNIGLQRSWSKFQLTFPHAKRIHLRECHLGREPVAVGNAIWTLLRSLNDHGNHNALEELFLDHCTVDAGDAATAAATTTVPVTLAWLIKTIGFMQDGKTVYQNQSVEFKISRDTARTAVLKFHS